MSKPTRSRARSSRSPLYLRVSELVDPSTGEVIGAFVPANSQERSIAKRRKFRVGEVIRCDLFRVRNPKHHRLAMKVLSIVVENQDKYRTVDALLTHIKIRLGRVEVFIDEGTDKTYLVPESIAFDAMEQDEFDVFYKQMLGVIRDEFFPTMSESEVERIVEMTKDET